MGTGWQRAATARGEMVMTWGEFKQKVETHDVKDTDQVMWIDWSGDPNGPEIARNPFGDQEVITIT